MIDFILTTILFTLPEAILVTLGVIYMLKIRCTSQERWIALGYTLIFLMICNVIPSIFMINILAILIVLPFIYKAWCSYYVSIWRYMFTIFCVLLVMIICETMCIIPIIYMLGLNVLEFSGSLYLLALLSIPTRVVEFFILFILNRRYYNG